MHHVGRYEILEKIGSGGFGTVYRARDPYIRREVAVKTCNRITDDLRERFLHEARIAASLRHPNIVVVHDFGFVGDLPFMVQELLPGQDLAQLIREGRRLVPQDTLDVLLQIARGLAHAHEQGVIHRDVKPANIRLLPDGQVKILDFGIAKLRNSDVELTRSGAMMGSAPYLAPEAWEAQPVDQRTDVFSFGVVAYELLSGRRPFDADAIPALSRQVLTGEPPRLARWLDGYPTVLDEIVHACLAKAPDARPPLAQVVSDLEAARRRLAEAPVDLGATSTLELAFPVTPPVSDASPVVRRRRKLWGVLVGLWLLAVVGLGFLLFNRSSPSPSPSAPPTATSPEISPAASILPAEQRGEYLARQLLAAATPSPALRLSLVGVAPRAPDHFSLPLGAPLRFAVTSAEAAYLVLFALAEDGTVTVIYPGPDGKQLALPARETVELPLAQDPLGLEATEVGTDWCFAVAARDLVTLPEVGAVPIDSLLTRYPAVSGRAEEPAYRLVAWLIERLREEEGWRLARLVVEVLPKN